MPVASLLGTFFSGISITLLTEQTFGSFFLQSSVGRGVILFLFLLLAGDLPQLRFQLALSFMELSNDFYLLVNLRDAFIQIIYFKTV
jgi:hypothetical protein